uniref:UDENN domain-containing protein n=1 Tax=Panagrellus redivivus TaxID=6233 RepID=A0A7E4WBE2_PANRE
MEVNALPRSLVLSKRRTLMPGTKAKNRLAPPQVPSHKGSGAVPIVDGCQHKLNLQSNQSPANGLVRRARLIRRTTTVPNYNVAKEAAASGSKSPKTSTPGIISEEVNRTYNDSADIDVVQRILIVKLKKTADATPEEVASLQGCRTDYLPYIHFAYPSVSGDEKLPPAPLFFPDFTQTWRPQSNEELGHFSVILTDEKGNRTFAYCYKYNEAPSSPPPVSRIFNHGHSKRAVVVILSNFPAENVFGSMARDIAKILQNRCDVESMYRDVVGLKITLQDPTEARFATVQYVTTAQDTLDWKRRPLAETIAKVGVENTIFIFLALLAEKRIIVTGKNVPEVTEAVQMFVRLLSPLEWPHTLIPIIPDTHTDLVYNPTPYICGILRYNLNILKDIICPVNESQREEIIVIDVKQGLIVPEFSEDDTKARRVLRSDAVCREAEKMGFPKGIVHDLIHMVKASTSNYRDNSLKIERAIMTWYAQLFGHVRAYQCGKVLLKAKPKRKFINEHPTPEVREFLLWFTETCIFQTFVLNILPDMDKAFLCGGYERFERLAKIHAPPVKGHWRKARSLAWRFLHR